MHLIIEDVNIRSCLGLEEKYKFCSSCKFSLIILHCTIPNLTYWCRYDMVGTIIKSRLDKGFQLDDWQVLFKSKDLTSNIQYCMQVVFNSKDLLQAKGRDQWKLMAKNYKNLKIYINKCYFWWKILENCLI